MKKKKISVLLIIFIMLLNVCLVSCSQDKLETNQTSKYAKEELAEKQILRVNWESEPQTLDSQITTESLSIDIVRATMEGLVRPDQNGFIKKGSGIAKDWEISEDGLHYKFYLRDAEWSDGTPITSEDFKYAWLRALNPETAAEYSALLYHIKGAKEYNMGKTKKENVAIKTPDLKTIEVELVRPTPQFLELTSFVTYVPAQKAAVVKYDKNYAADVDKIVYSGPFVISEWNHDENIILKKNPNYWDADNVKLQAIIGNMLDATTSINLYDGNELDVIPISSEFIERYKNNSEYKIIPSACTWFLEYNMTNEIMNNYHIRAAFSQAVDCDSFVKCVLNGVGLSAKGLTPPGMPGKEGKLFNELRTSELLSFNVEAAKKHLKQGIEELGITKEDLEKEVTLLTGDNPTIILFSQAFQQMWKENLGLHLNVENKAYSLRRIRYDEKDYTISISAWGGDYNDPISFMDLLVTNGGNNDAYYSNPEYDKCIDIALKARGDERFNALLKAEELIAKDIPIYPIYHSVRDVLERPYVKDIVRPLCGASNDYKWAYMLKH